MPQLDIRRENRGSDYFRTVGLSGTHHATQRTLSEEL